jgi:hypothetical protein
VDWTVRVPPSGASAFWTSEHECLIKAPALGADVAADLGAVAAYNSVLSAQLDPCPFDVEVRCVDPAADPERRRRDSSSRPRSPGNETSLCAIMPTLVQILPLIQSAVAARLELSPSLPGNTDLLYLDLALEDVVRGAVERGVGGLGMGAAAFVGPLLQNLVRRCACGRCLLALHADGVQQRKQ